MSYADYQLNGSGLTKPENYIDRYYEYEKNQGKEYATRNSYDTNLIEGYFGEYFNTHNFINFDEAVINNQAVMTAIRLPNGESHGIVVVGVSKYGGSDTLIYMDSNFGELRQIKESDIEIYLYRIPVSKK